MRIPYLKILNLKEDKELRNDLKSVRSYSSKMSGASNFK